MRNFSGIVGWYSADHIPGMLAWSSNISITFIVNSKIALVFETEMLNSSSLRPGTKGFTCGQWIIDYNFGIDDGAESKFGTHKELIVLNILKYKHSVNRSRDMPRGHFAKNRKLLANWWPV